MNTAPILPGNLPVGGFLVVDGHAYAYRAFYAIRSLTSPSGEPTNAIYGFISMLERMRALLLPEWVAVVWDGGLAPERLAAHPSYKAQRPPMPESLGMQIDQIRQYLAAASVASFQRDQVEADDWIAGLARTFARDQRRVVIASADKDFMQLVSPLVGLLNPNDKVPIIWSDKEVRAKTGVEPAAVLDWLALVGDSVDNIPGVPGIGPKTAADLLNRFGSVDALYSRLSEVQSARIRAALETSEAVVRRNQELVRLRHEMAPEVDSTQLVPREPDFDQLRLLYQRWGFKKLLSSLEVSRDRQVQLL